MEDHFLKTHICVKPNSGYSTACNGEPGNPILLEHDGQFRLQGIVLKRSNETGQCLIDAEYVASHADWIFQNVHVGQKNAIKIG